MMVQNTAPQRVVSPLEQVTSVIDQEHSSYVDWPAILAGTAVGSAISLLFLSFGSAIGLALTPSYEGTGMSLMAFAISGALWLVWVQISGFFAGGYLAGRLRRRVRDATEHESDVRDGSHGLIVWALGLLIGAMISLMGITGAIGMATNATSNLAGGAVSAMTAETMPSASPLNQALGLSVDRFLRSGPATGAAAVPPATNAASADPREEIGRILASTVEAGTLDDTDRAYLANLVAARAGLTPEEANARVDQLIVQANAAQQELQVAADRARKIAIIAAFITAVSLLVSGVAAYAGAVLGGNHRDSQHVIAGWTGRW